MPTKAVLEQRLISRTQERDTARESSVDTCSLRRLTTALLDRISQEQGDTGDERDRLNTRLDKLDEAYSAADKADDMVIELEE